MDSRWTITGHSVPSCIWILLSGLLLMLVILTGCTTPALHSRIADHDTEGAQALIRQKQGVDTVSRAGRAPIHVAVASGNSQVVSDLIAAGANINARTYEGETALVMACRRKQSDIARLLIEAGAALDPPYPATNALSEAISYGHTDLVRLLVSKGANVNVRNRIGETPLFYAALAADTGMLAYLVGHGADIHLTSHDNRNVLSVASFRRDTRMMDYLLDAGVQVSPAKGSEVGVYATALAHEYVAKRLLERHDPVQARAHVKQAIAFYKSSEAMFGVAAIRHQASIDETQGRNALLMSLYMMQLSTVGHGPAWNRNVMPAFPGLAGAETPESLKEKYLALALQCRKSAGRLEKSLQCLAQNSEGGAQACL